MTHSGRTPRVIIALGAALLIAYALIWAQLTPFDIGRSDFTAFYVGGSLLRQGHAAQLYDEALQAPLHARLIAPDREGNLPFVDPPVAAALVTPATLLTLDSAYRLWAVLELGVLAAAVGIGVRAAARRAIDAGAARPPGAGWVAGVAALAGTGTLFTWTQAQWTPLFALGVALAYHAWDRRPAPTTRAAALGAAALVAGALVGKPQLALGLLAFMAGWRRRGLLLGGAAAAAAVAVVSLALVGPAGMAGFIRMLAGSGSRWDQHLMLGASGVAAAYAGTGAAAYVLTGMLAVSACAAAYALGRRARRDGTQLPIALAGAAALSLLAAPHAYLDDLAMLAPAAAWCLTAALEQRDSPWSGRALPVLVALWGALNVAALGDLSVGGRLPTGPLTAYLLAIAGAAALAVTRAQPVHLRYGAGDEAALGPVAHGVRRG